MKQILAALFCLTTLGACCCVCGTAAKTDEASTPGPAGPAQANPSTDTPGPAGPAGPAKSASAAEAPGPAAPMTAAQSAPAPEPPDPARVSGAHADALHWLAAQQAEDGSWSGGEANVNKIGLTGLALLALQSDGSTMGSGHSSQAIARGVQWLISQQDPQTGVYGVRAGISFIYNHAIATQAMCIALKGAPSDQLRRSAQDAVNLIAQARNPYGAWRYTYPPTGENDTSVTGWMVEALVAAKEAGLSIDEQAFVGATAWIDEVTDPATARVGYDSVGSRSSRVTGLNDQFDPALHEAMTASGMLTRMNAGQTPGSNPILNQHAALLRKKLPEWDPEGKLVDEYYWYFGSLATRRLAGKDWETWRAATAKALLDSQEQKGDAKGSWKPAGPWGYAGGPVFATSLNALSLATML